MTLSDLFFSFLVLSTDAGQTHSSRIGTSYTAKTGKPFDTSCLILDISSTANKSIRCVAANKNGVNMIIQLKQLPVLHLGQVMHIELLTLIPMESKCCIEAAGLPLVATKHYFYLIV